MLKLRMLLDFVYVPHFGRKIGPTTGVAILNGTVMCHWEKEIKYALN